MDLATEMWAVCTDFDGCSHSRCTPRKRAKISSPADRKIEELEATITQLQSALKEQAAQIQKVSEPV